MSFEKEVFAGAIGQGQKKDFLPFDLAQSKTVKRAIATFFLESALFKSSPHMMLVNFVGEVSRLRKAGFPEHLLTGVTEALLQKFKGRKKDVEDTRL